MNEETLGNDILAFRKQDLIVLAGVSGVGKTSLALKAVSSALVSPNPAGPSSEKQTVKPVGILIFSLDESAHQVAFRMICSRAMIRRREVIARHGNSDDAHRLRAAATELCSSPVYINDSRDMTVEKLSGEARRLHARIPLCFIVVDHVQLLNPRGSLLTLEQQVSENLGGLKCLAKDLDIPVLALLEFKRCEVEKRRLCKLSDLGRWACIKERTDILLVLSGPKIAERESQTNGEKFILTVAKQRADGAGDSIPAFSMGTNCFEDISN